MTVLEQPKGQLKASEASQIVEDTLDKAGFVTHHTKSVWTPTTRLQWLGFILDLAKVQISVPLEKVAALHLKLGVACQTTSLTARSLASIVGAIISIGPGIGPIARFMTHSLYGVLELRNSWCDHLQLSPKALLELQFWKQSLSDSNCQPI